MNAPPWLDRALKALQDQGFEVETAVPADDDSSADLLLRLRRHRATRSYLVHLKTKPQPALIQQNGADLPRLLVSPHLTRHQDSTCERLGLDYVDAAGNMLLDWGEVYVHISGRRPTPELLPPSTVASAEHPAFRPRGLQVVLTLLCTPDRLPTHREIALNSGASLGTTNNVMRDLESQGYLTTHGTPRLHRLRELFDRWTSAYLLNLYARLDMGAYRTESEITTIIPTEPADPVAISGEAAVSLMYGQLRPTTLTLYASERPRKLLIRWRARTADSPAVANVLVRKKFWDLPGPAGLAPTPLIHADLLASSDPRQIEAAALLRSRDGLLRAIDQR